MKESPPSFTPTLNLPALGQGAAREPLKAWSAARHLSDSVHLNPEKLCSLRCEETPAPRPRARECANPLLAPEDGMGIGATEAKGTHVDDTLGVVVATQLAVEERLKSCAFTRIFQICLVISGFLVSRLPCCPYGIFCLRDAFSLL